MTATGSTDPVVTVTPETAPTGTSDAEGPVSTSAERGLARIPWQEGGYLNWEYDGHKINYVDEGDKSKVMFLAVSGDTCVIQQWT